MEMLLKALFDFCRFERNTRLSRLIEETNGRYGKKLSDDELELVSAAGDIDSAMRKKYSASGDSFDE